MNQIITISFTFFILFFNYSQELDETQFDSTILYNKPIIVINKKGEINRDVNLITNMRFALNTEFDQTKLESVQLKANDVRVELIGKLNDKLRIRFRDVLSRSAGDANFIDLLRRSIDLAFIEYEIVPKRISISAGKMFGDFGGYEIFYNPITMVVYNDWLANGDIFLSSIKTNLSITKNQKISFQISNSSSRSFSFNYGDTEGVKASKIPFGYTINWNGSFLNNNFNTKFSYSCFNIAYKKYMNLIVLGNQFRKNKLTIEYDLKFSLEDLDRTNLVSNYLGNTSSNRVKNVCYIEHWLRMAYDISKKFKISGIIMTNSNYWKNNMIKNNFDKMRNTYTYVTTLEYNISKIHNFKLFLSHFGRFDNYTSFSKNNFDLKNHFQSQIHFGFMSQLIVF